MTATPVKKMVPTATDYFLAHDINCNRFPIKFGEISQISITFWLHKQI